MKVTIDIDVKAARSALYISSGSPEQTRVATEGTDEEVINLALKHCRCWGIQRIGETK